MLLTNLLAPVLALAVSASPSPAEQPLTALPYTAGLEPSFMDRAVDPCVDFYAYACGGWQRLNPIPPDQGYLDVYARLREDITRYLWGIVSEAAQPRPHRSAVEARVGDFFASCMDEEAIEAQGARPLAPALKALTAVRDGKGLARWLAEQHLLTDGSELLFGMGPEQDYQDTTRVIVRVGAGGLGLPDRDDYLDEDAKSVALRARYQEHIRRLLTLAGDRDEWEGNPQSLDGSYHDTLNDMEFGAGILQPPLFDPKMDLAPNYGDTGGMMGHELIHGFDDNGRRFDAHGVLRDWWTKQDGEEFTRRASCISDQYSRYVAVEEVHVNGKLTLGEDVADLGGLILAHRAWKTVTAGKQLTPKDGLTPEQRFFVGYAQWACANVRPETARNWARTDPHSPNVYRVNGVVVNMPEFAEAFRCKAGQPMVKPPEQVCRVW